MIVYGQRQNAMNWLGVSALLSLPVFLSPTFVVETAPW